MARIRVGNEELEFVSKSDGIIELEQGQEIPAAIFADELGRVKFRDRDSVSVFMSTLAALGGNVKQIDAAAGQPSDALPPEVVVYIDLNTLRLYKRTESGWGAGLELRGQDGPKGDTGARGRTILYGEANPNTRVDLNSSIIGDMYVETGPDNNPEHQLWAKVREGSDTVAWERIGRPYGRIPVDGTPGQRGRSIFEGTSDPRYPTGPDIAEIANAVNGDLYIETDRFVIWKKVDGSWIERGQSFKGVNGSAGSPGARGKSVFEGTVNPNDPYENYPVGSQERNTLLELSTSQIGDVYINTLTHLIYKRKNATGVLWETSGTSFKGSDGTSGNTIFQGIGNPNLESTPKPDGFENAKFGDVYLDTTTHTMWKYTSEYDGAHWTSVGEPYKPASIIQGKGDPNYFALLETEPVIIPDYTDIAYDWSRVRSARIGDAYVDLDAHDIWNKKIELSQYDETNPALNKIWIKKGSNLTGPPAETLILESNSYFIGYDSKGKNPKPDSFTLTAVTKNFPESGLSYRFGKIIKQGGVKTKGTPFYTGVNSSIDINLLDVQPGQNTYDYSVFFADGPITYYVDVIKNGNVYASDTATIAGALEGSDGITVLLTNDTHVFPANNEGEIDPSSYSYGGTEILAYLGAEILTPVSPAQYSNSVNCFKIKLHELSGISAANSLGQDGLPTDLISVGEFLENTETSDQDDLKFICYPKNWTSTTSNASITFEIFIKNSAGRELSPIYKTQSFSRANEGDRGRAQLQGTGDPNLISRTTNPFTKISWGVYSNSNFGVPIVEAERDYEEVMDANVGDRYIDLSTSLTYIKLASSWQQNQVGLLSNVEKKNQSAFSVYRWYMGKNWRIAAEFDSIGIWGDDDAAGWFNFQAFRKNCSSKFIDVSNTTGEDFYRISTVGISPGLIGNGNEASIELYYNVGSVVGSQAVLDTKFATRMRAKIRRTPGVITPESDYSWVGRIEFLTFDGVTFQATYDINRRATQSLTILDSTKSNQNEWVVVEWDLSILPAWKNKTILGIKWCIFDKPNNSIDVEWITFGSPNFSPSITYNSIRQNDSVSGKGYIIPSYDIGMHHGSGGGEVSTTLTTPRLIRTKTLTQTFTRVAPGYTKDSYTGIDISGIEIDDSNNISGIRNLSATGNNVILGNSNASTKIVGNLTVEGTYTNNIKGSSVIGTDDSSTTQIKGSLSAITGDINLSRSGNNINAHGTLYSWDPLIFKNTVYAGSSEWRTRHFGSLNFEYRSDSTGPFVPIGYLANNEDVGAINFTGQHRSIPVNESLLDRKYVGLIVVSTGFYDNTQDTKNKKDNISINESLPIVELSKKKNQKSIFGVISNCEDRSELNREYRVGSFVSLQNKKTENDNRLVINAIGEGAIWITNINGNLENGDYITSSEIPGYGMKQNSEALMNYTVAKITCDCDFDLNSEVYNCEEFEWEGKTYRKAFVGCTYHCG
jgi:hypothetical protein